MGSKFVQKRQRASFIQHQAVAKAIETLEKRVLFASFSPGSVIVETLGQNATTTTSVPITLNEYLSSGSPGISLALPTSGTGIISDNGNSGANGFISLSASGNALEVPGFGVAPGTATVITGSTNPRVIDSVDASGNVTQPVSSTTAFSGTYIRAATSDGLGNYWASGPSQGINYLGTGTPSIVETANTNTRQVTDINGNLYYTVSSTTSGLSGVYEVGSGGLPTAAGTTSTQIISQGGTTGAPYGIAISPDGKTIYLADSRSVATGGGVQKWTSTTGAAGSFSLAYTFGADGSLGLTEGDQGLAVDFSGANPVIYATTSESSGSSANKFIKIVDPGTASLAATTNGTLLATSTGGPTGTVFRGVALSPNNALSITSITPQSGSTSGGTTVTISGGGFTGATGVTFGTKAATSFAVVNSTTITAVSPSGSGTVDLTVTTPVGSASTSAGAGDQFTFTLSPVVSGVTPNFGATTGNNLVTINGSNFTASAANTTVKFGTVTATGVTVLSATQITAIAPAESGGPVDVTVTIGGVTSGTVSADQYTYYDTPTIASLSLTTGLDGGGQAITITGTNFSPGSTVSFGGVAPTSVVVVSSTVITAVTPAAATQGASSVGVTVTNVKTTSAATTFNYILTTIAAAEAVIPSVSGSGPTVTLDSNPVITQILQNGPTTDNAGGTSRSYTYTAFLVQDSTGSMEIFCPPSISQVYSATVGNTITATGIPVYFDGTPELGGSSNASLTALSTVATATVPTPQVKTITQINTVPSTTPPPLPLNVAGYPITVKGVDIAFTGNTSFGSGNLTGTITDTSGASMVLFYGPSSNETVYDNLFTTTIPTKLVDVTGFLSDATVNSVLTTEFNVISITNPTTVAPVLTSLNPAGGPPGGTNLVTITGNGFTSPNVSQVYFGGVSHPATGFTIVSDTVITATAPSGSGTVSVTVVNTNGTSNAESYAYGTAPIVTSIVPTAIPAGASHLITINGTGFTGANAVSFGTGFIVTTGISVINDGQLTVTAPSETAGTVDVIVTTSSGGAGTANANDKLTYATVPTVTTITPSSGSVVGGTSVTITGTGFVVGATTVTIDGLTPTSTTISSTTQIIIVTPQHTATGAVTVAVTTTGGTANGTFTYVPANIAAAEAQGSGVVSLTSNPVITQILETTGTSANGKTYTTNNFLVQDSSGSTSIFGNFPAGSTFVPIVGHTISVTGTYTLYEGNPEIETITAISDTGTGTAAYPNPLPETVSTINVATPVLGTPPTGYGEYLITLSNVTIGGLTPGTSFGTGANLTGTITDGTNTMVLYYAVGSFEDANTNLATMLIPATTTHVNIEGIVTTYQGTAQFDPINITPYVAATPPAWLSGTVTTYNPGSSIIINSGTIIADPALSGDGSIAIIITGPVNVNLPSGTTTIHTGSVSINSGDTFTLAPPSGLTATPPTPILITSNLVISGEFDIANGFVDLVSGSGSESLATATTSVSNGFDGGKWDKPGIISSTALASPLHGVGVISATGAGTLDGYSYASGDVLLKYTYFGDADLNGKVDATDYSRIDNAYLNHLTGWFNGDFNYDGVVNGSDYTLIDNAFNRQGAVIPSAIVAGAATPNAVVFTPAPPATPATVFSDKKVKESLADQIDDLITG